jgi:hypothetical protein
MGSCMDSKYWRYVNANPKGKRTDDCVVRALCIPMHKTWEQVLRDLTEYSVKYGEIMFVANIYGRYLEDNGWIKHKQPVHEDGTKVRISEFLDNFKGVAVANAGKEHVTFLYDGYVWDLGDCSDRVMGNYWTKDDEEDEDE